MSFRALIIIALFIVVANSAFLIFGYDSSPIWWTTSTSARVCLWACGIPSIDPNVGFITQPLAHVAALDLLHGHLPWWNYFEGMGQPLAGEMQSAALSPLVLLFIFPAGLLLFHLSLQFIAGASTYFLVRRLGVGATIATLGGVLFALNGTFSWIANAVFNPIAFLPALILGVEIVLEHSRESRRAGWILMALALALSIYSGFPEVAYLDGLLAVGWTLTRLFSLERRRRFRALGKLSLGGVVGVALAAPLLVAFADFARFADVGDHATQALSLATTPWRNLPILVDPYLSGTLFGGPSATPSNLLGYVTASVTVFAVVGVVGPRLRPLRIFLASWVALALAGCVSFLGMRGLWDYLPQMSEVAFARYVWPAVEFAVVILALLGLGDIVEGGARRTVARWATVGVALVCAGGVLVVVPLGGHVKGSYAVAEVILIALPFLALVVVGYNLQYLQRKNFRNVTVAVLAFESLMFFTTPTFRNPVDIRLADSTISYLQQHEGLSRFVSIGALNPNWGSQFGINEINAIDLPAPLSLSNYIHNHLAPSLAVPRTFVLPFNPGIENEFAAHVADYEALGVEYLLVPHRTLTPSLAAIVGGHIVAEDFENRLYQLSHVTAFYSTSVPSCVISGALVDQVSVNCPQASSLTRLELMLPGWTARVNGVKTAISSNDALTQTLSLPVGTSSVKFSYLPPHEKLAGILCALALAAIAATWRPRRARATEVDPPLVDEDVEPREETRHDDIPSLGTLLNSE